MWDPYTEFQSAILPNGLSVHTAHWPGRPWEAMGFLIHSGAEYDPVGLEGLSHFIEHVISENTNTSKKEMEVFFENCGGMVDFGRTGYPDTCYRFFVPADKTVIARAFSMFGHMLLSAKLEKFIERERQVIIGEFHSHYPVEFEFELDTRKHKTLYTGYWLERSVRPLGNPESVTRITQSDLQSHYDINYTPANISVVGVGGMQLLELVELLYESPFATSKKGNRTPLPIPTTTITPPLETRHILEISKYITIPIEVGAYRSIARIPGSINDRVVYIIKEMLNKILFEEVRENRAWAYAINSSLHNFRHFYEFSINCDTLTLNALDDIDEVIETCIASILNRKDLFEWIKHRALASIFMTDPNGRSICDGALDSLTENQRIKSLREVSDDLNRITMSDIRDTLQWLRLEQRWTLVVRP